MSVNISDSQNSKDYYDLERDRVTVRGFSYSDNANDAKMIKHSGIIENMYCITVNGKVYSIISNTYILWSIRNNLPYVNLSCMHDGVISLESFYIKDLMACSFIRDYESYLERGCKAVNIDGNTYNCNYSNILYI